MAKEQFDTGRNECFEVVSKKDELPRKERTEPNTNLLKGYSVYITIGNGRYLAQDEEDILWIVNEDPEKPRAVVARNVEELRDFITYANRMLIHMK